MNNKPWEAIFKKYNISKHEFSKSPFVLTAQQIKTATKTFKNTNEREVRILCKQDTKESRPDIFVEKGLFLLPIKNGTYVIVKGEGYVDIPSISKVVNPYTSKLNFDLDTSSVGNSEMQHLDFAYASSLIRTFLEDDTLVLTIRGRKYTPKFKFKVGNQMIETKSVQTEVDGGYEGRDKIVLVEAKNSQSKNVIIRQLFYPFRQWSCYSKKKVVTLFFEKRSKFYSLWQFEFMDKEDYNSIKLVKSARYEIVASK